MQSPSLSHKIGLEVGSLSAKPIDVMQMNQECTATHKEENKQNIGHHA
jgi:hypothetical protein